MSKDELVKKIIWLAHDVIWDVEANREIEGKSFIEPKDLRRITAILEDTADDVSKL